MQLIFYCVGFMAAGDVADYLIGLVVERIWPQASLVIFLALYFLFLWFAWLLAVKLTEPKDSKRLVGRRWERLADRARGLRHSSCLASSLAAARARE